jgi:hypothetical protein
MLTSGLLLEGFQFSYFALPLYLAPNLRRSFVLICVCRQPRLFLARYNGTGAETVAFEED